MMYNIIRNVRKTCWKTYIASSSSSSLSKPSPLTPKQAKYRLNLFNPSHRYYKHDESNKVPEFARFLLSTISHTAIPDRLTKNAEMITIHSIQTDITSKPQTAVKKIHSHQYRSISSIRSRLLFFGLFLSLQTANAHNP